MRVVYVEQSWDFSNQKNGLVVVAVAYYLLIKFRWEIIILFSTDSRFLAVYYSGL